MDRVTQLHKEIVNDLNTLTERVFNNVLPKDTEFELPVCGGRVCVDDSEYGCGVILNSEEVRSMKETGIDPFKDGLCGVCTSEKYSDMKQEIDYDNHYYYREDL